MPKKEMATPVSATLVYYLTPDDFRVLLADSLTHIGQVTFPGGKADPGESALQCALRELQQESGLIPKSPKNMTPVFSRPALVETTDGTFALSLFLCNFLATNRQFRVPEDERVKLFNLRFVPSQVLYNFVLLGKISPLVLGGNWEQRLRSEMGTHKMRWGRQKGQVKLK
jgi:8-oxo-dGTP pyrophosphatase MutT (NUDIX family)